MTDTSDAPKRKPGEHPRLFLTADELIAVREQSKTGLRTRLLERLRAACAEITDPASPVYLDFRERTSDLWRTRHGIFRTHTAIGTLALGHALLDDEAAGAAARDAVMTIIEEGLADMGASAYGVQTQGWRHGAGHDKHNIGLAMCLAYDFCYGLFTPEQRARFAEYGKESIRIAHDEAWMQDWFQVANNRGVRGILCGTYWALTLEGDAGIENIAWQIREGELALEHFLYLAYGSDGAPFEGPGYGGSLNSPAFAAEALRLRGGPNQLTCNRFERLSEYQIYQLMPGGGSLDDLNDAHAGSGGSVVGSLHLLGRPGGELVPWLAQQLDLHPDRIGGFLDTLGNVPPVTFLMFLKWWRDDVPARTPSELGYPLSRLFADRGVASMRTGWEKNDWLVTHFCGRQQYKCHRQSDQNHINLYALGERFLVDAGYGHGDRDMAKAVDRWFGCTEAHNCVLIDGEDQRGTGVTPGWVEGEMLDWRHTEDFDTTLGDASSAVGPDHRVRRALRRVVLVKAGPAPYLAVLDVNEKDGEPFEAAALWHTDLDIRIEPAEGGFIIKGKASDCHALVLWPEGATPSLAKGYDRPQARVAVEDRVVEMLTVFCPRRPGEALPTFTCRRESEGAFTVTCETAGARSILHLSTRVDPPLRKPLPVQLGACENGEKGS